MGKTFCHLWPGFKSLGARAMLKVMGTDHFSCLAGDYARYRPGYPPVLFAWLAGQSPGRKLCWDCACGNGQASEGLAKFFDSVVATDLSAEQIKNAKPHPKIIYRVMTAEAADFSPQSLDLVTVAQAAHWLDLPKFYEKVRVFLKPGGVLALWAYSLFKSEPAVDELVGKFYSETVGPYWPDERKWVEKGYAIFPFPFDEIEKPDFEMRLEWSREDMLHYLGTWSAVKRYKEAKAEDPIPALNAELGEVWRPGEIKTFRWKLDLQVGKK
jgi:SAM-dependent methyltransferase